MTRLLSNILAWLAVVVAAASTSVGTCVVWIAIAWKWHFPCWKFFLFGMGFFLVWHWGGFFLASMLAATSQSLASKAEESEAIP